MVTALKVGATNTFSGMAMFHQMTVRRKKELAVHLDAGWDDLIFVWVVISCTVQEQMGTNKGRWP